MYTAISRKVVEKGARDNHESNCGWLWVHCSSKKFERMTHTLGTRGFSRVRREFSVFVGRRRVTIKTWQKPETALEKSLSPRVNDTRTYLHMFASAKDSNKSRFDSYGRYKQCIDHIPYYLSRFYMQNPVSGCTLREGVQRWDWRTEVKGIGLVPSADTAIDLGHSAAILSQDIKKALYLHG